MGIRIKRIRILSHDGSGGGGKGGGGRGGSGRVGGNVSNYSGERSFSLTLSVSYNNYLVK